MSRCSHSLTTWVNAFVCTGWRSLLPMMQRCNQLQNFKRVKTTSSYVHDRDRGSIRNRNRTQVTQQSYCDTYVKIVWLHTQRQMCCFCIFKSSNCVFSTLVQDASRQFRILTSQSTN
jgi:hypothetical protein